MRQTATEAAKLKVSEPQVSQGYHNISQRRRFTSLVSSNEYEYEIGDAQIGVMKIAVSMARVEFFAALNAISSENRGEDNSKSQPRQLLH